MKTYIIEYGYSAKEPSLFTEIMASNLESAKQMFNKMHTIKVKNPYGDKPKVDKIPRIWNIKEKPKQKKENPKQEYERNLVKANKSYKSLAKAKKYAETKAKKHAKDKIWHKKHPEKLEE